MIAKDWISNRPFVQISDLTRRLHIEPIDVAVFLSKIGDKRQFKDSDFIDTRIILKHYNLFNQITIAMTSPKTSTKEATIKGRKSQQKKAHMQVKHRDVEEYFIRRAEPRRA